MIEFFIILRAVGGAVGSGSFMRLLVGTLFMLVFGYAGEAGLMDYWLGFGLGMIGWAVIIYEIFGGEAGKAAASLFGVRAVSIQRHAMDRIELAGQSTPSGMLLFQLWW